MAGAAGAGAAPSTGGRGGVSIPQAGGKACASEHIANPIFLPYVVRNEAPAHKVLYSWTTPEQVAELRRDRQLFVRSEQVGMGRGYAFDVIAGLALRGSSPEAVELAKRLSTDLFPKIRYAWPYPWATRMGWPGEDYGNQLLRIVLKDSAWTVRVMAGEVSVVDSVGAVVPLATALATPERIAAIFFVKDQASGGWGCAGTFGPTVGGTTYREFILGNEAMIEEWSLGTEEILQQISKDIVALSTFLNHVRGCAPTTVSLGFAAACEWTMPGVGTELTSYLRALSLPSDYYFPESGAVAKIVDTLEGDLFEPDPLLVIPGQ